MATAAVLSIFIFVVGGALSSNRSYSGGEQNAANLVATWNGGSLNQGQLHDLVAFRAITDTFLKQVFVTGGGSNFQYDFPRNIPFLLLPDSRKTEDLQQAVINTEVLSSLATKAGLSVSDNIINHYIDEIGLKKVGGAEIEAILERLGQGNPRQNEAIIFSTLRKMLLGWFYSQMYGDQSQVVLPQQRWDDWRKVNERISLQVAELPIDKFLPQVPEPTDAQLLTFFNEHKEADPSRVEFIGGQELPSPEPGFAEPHRVRLQYLQGSLAQRAEKLEPTITEEQIKEYYEKNKATEFTKMSSLGDAKAAEGKTPATPAPPSDKKPEGQPDPGATPPAASENAPANSTAPAADAAKPEDASAETPPASEPSAGAPAAPAPGTGSPSTPPAPAGESQPPAESKAPASDSEPAKQSSSNEAGKSPFRFVALQTAPAEQSPDSAKTAESAPAASAESSSAPAQATAESKEAPAETTADKPAASETPAAPAAPAADAKSAEASAGAGSPADANSENKDAATADKKEPEPEYEPLDKVRDEIRKKLAAEKAEAELDKIMGQATAEVQSDYYRYGSQVAEADEAKREAPKPPARLTDLKWLADKFGLTYEKTAPLTILELRETPYGRAFDATSQRVPVMQAAFTTLKLYEPFLAREFGGDWYLVMKVEDLPHRVPEFKEVRDKVAKAWKEQEAAKLAEKEAKNLAAEAEKAATPFDQFFADKGYNVIKQTELFSWLSYPLGRESFGSPPQLSSVPELKNVGPSFMEAAFSLDGNKAVGLLNYDHSMAYVIRLNRRQYSDEELKKLFLEEEAPWPGQVGLTMFRPRVERFDNAVNEELLKDRAGFEFDPDWLKAERERQEKQQG
jgi:hypothetical protein